MPISALCIFHDDIFIKNTLIGQTLCTVVAVQESPEIYLYICFKESTDHWYVPLHTKCSNNALECIYI